jgi:hypothetical protein
MIEATIWGMFFYGTTLLIERTIGKYDSRPRETLPQESYRGIHLSGLVGYLLVFLKHANEMLSLWPNEGPLSIDIRLSGILDIAWIYTEDNLMYEGPVSELDDDFSFPLPTTTAALRDQADALAMSILQYILFGMNWPDRASDPDVLGRLVRHGYNYNGWGIPAELKL